MATKKIAQTVITEDKFYTIAAANGKVVEVKDTTPRTELRSSCGIMPTPNGSSGALCAPARACTASRTVSPAR